MKHFLTVIVPDKKAVKYALKGDIVSIGRGEDNAITLDSTAVSSNHLQIHKTHTGYRLIDLDSTNGTTVNGERLSDHHLADGDELIIGTAIRAQYEAVADESTAATAPASPLPPKTVSAPSQPVSPTVVLKRAPASAVSAAKAASQPIDPPTDIRPRKMTPPGLEAPAEEATQSQAQPESEVQPAGPKIKVPNPGQSSGPKKLNLG